MNLLVSAGPTREFFDSVRFISNPSSGKMGYAIAREAARRGHDVTLVTGPVAIPAPKGVRTVQVVTAAEMARACKAAFRHADAAVMTAAVCDYRPAERVATKRPKQARPMRITLEPTEDIAASLGARKGRRILVCFAMEDHDPHAKAERKLKRKNCDLIVLNGPENVGSEEALVELYNPAGGWRPAVEGSKDKIAAYVLDEIELLTGERKRPSRARRLTRRQLLERMSPRRRGKER